MTKCIAVLAVTLAARSAQSQQNSCDKYASFEASENRYRIQTNRWGSDKKFCIALTESGFRISQSEINNANDKGPGAYPAVYRGCHYGGNCTDNSGMPIQVNKISSVLTNWTTTQPDSGTYNVAYDLWLHTTKDLGEPDGAEIMVWLSHRGGIQPAGSKLGTVTIGGATYAVWHTKMEKWEYVAYVSEVKQTEVTNLDLAGFLTDAVTRGYVKPTWWLGGVEAGFEIWKGGMGLATTKFMVNVTASK